MLFDSHVYFVFLTLVVLVSWRLRFRAQNAFLLAASYFFYGWWDWRFALLTAGPTTIDFLIARRIGHSSNERRRRFLLILSLCLNFSFLGFFKYFNFFVESFVKGLAALGVRSVSVTMLHIVLPASISFYTFREVSYIVDVYHRKLPTADSLIDYGLFISLFLHLIAARFNGLPTCCPRFSDLAPGMPTSRSTVRC